MVRRRLLILSAILLLIWIAGMFVFHTTLEGYLHMFLLLATNSALFCIVREEKEKRADEQIG
ncbi:hypothetical protein QNI22_03835 [Cytophagaceae bacterium BD1B2-1]|uniref:Uncharacterized protein n=1 Tax=Xanthocytophaga agilis TaxID=3048010 RepID=A0AAE3R148_9BACT|nr:hypothetical protein [Xanthocytophaga agilis]